jgi:hypothetical protein
MFEIWNLYMFGATEIKRLHISFICYYIYIYIYIYIHIYIYIYIYHFLL